MESVLGGSPEDRGEAPEFRPRLETLEDRLTPSGVSGNVITIASFNSVSIQGSYDFVAIQYGSYNQISVAGNGDSVVVPGWGSHDTLAVKGSGDSLTVKGSGDNVTVLDSNEKVTVKGSNSIVVVFGGHVNEIGNATVTVS